FYRLPKESAFLGWHEKTPENFIFSVKGSRFITHVKRLKDCGQPLELFFSRLMRLGEKLGPVLWQLPPAFKADPKRLNNFFKALKKYKGVKHVFEFRDETWLADSIVSMLISEGAALCGADWPVFNKDIRVTADFIYFRRHGLAAEPYGGCYSDKQIGEDARMISGYSGKGMNVYIYFNNDAYGHAVKNTLELKKQAGMIGVP
ncbi:MAG: hypothetical protein A2Z72_00005, partial [Omnitrophica bacterium RBG_13_46_9]